MSPEKLQRVLVIDDDADILAVIRITLQARGGFEVEVCQSSREAPGVARRFVPDLILLDVMMPGIDGPTTLEALRDDPQTAAMPVVFMTAKAMPHETARYLDLGAAAVIAKPFDQRTLADELEQIVRRSPSSALEHDDSGQAELLDAYAEALPAKVLEIRELWARVESGPDAEATRSLYLRVHNLAGTAATYGHPTLSDIAKQLEQMIDESTGGGADAILGSRQAAAGLIDALDAAARSGRTVCTTD
jgi:two-component system OmpR family response regulator